MTATFTTHRYLSSRSSLGWRWRWTLTGPDGAVLAKSGDGFATRVGAEAVIAAVKLAAGDAEVDDLTGDER